MTFSDLPMDMQNFFIVQSSNEAKKIFIFLLLAFSIFYIFYWKPHKEQKTPFFSIGIFRICLTTISYINLFAFPLMLLFLVPEYDFMSLMTICIGVYGAIITAFLVIAGADFFYFGWGVTAKMMGLDMNNKRVDDVFRKYFKKKREYG